MKYLFFLFTLFGALTAHSQCSEFDNLIKKGDNYLKGSKPDYQEAINAYTAAILACSDRAGVAKLRITQMVNEIHKLKESAVAAEKGTAEARDSALVAEKKATEAQKEIALERDKAQTALANLEKSLTDIRAKNRTIFENFTSLGTNLIYTLNYAEALEKMKVAVDIEVDADFKRQQLTEPIAELLYFFAESGRRLDLARTAAQLLLQLNAENGLAQSLQQCIQENWNTRTQFASLLKKLPYYSKFEARYYPELVSVPLGEDSIFEMGSEPLEWGHQVDEQVHKVKLSTYKIAVTPTTFYQFALFSEAMDRNLTNRTPYWGRFGDHPLVNVNWYETLEYANWLNFQNNLSSAYQILKENNSDPNNRVPLDLLKWKVDWDKTAKGFRLPTEAEWELAARAGIGAPRTLFAGSDTLDLAGWFWENSGDKPLSYDWDLNRIYENNGRTHPVKQKKDNGIGLYDMSGNVSEWCWDWYSINYYKEYQRRRIKQNPVGAKKSGKGRVIRGGCWGDKAETCRTGNRHNISPATRQHTLGFRLVFVP